MSKKPKPPLPDKPFTVGEVLDAARAITGSDVLSPDIETELRKAIDGYQKRLTHLQNAHRKGDYHLQHDALRRVYSAPAARIVAFVLANGKTKHLTMSWDQIKETARKVLVCRPSGERVKARPEPKATEGHRWVCIYSPLARAAQCMVKHIIFVVAGPSPYEFAQKGHGRDAAARVTLHEIKNGGVRCFGLADVKDCFPSITREMVKKAMPFLPMSIIDGTIFVHEETVIKFPYLSYENTHHSETVIRSGLPQGSLVSPLIASKVLEPHLDAVDARLVLIHVDNILIGAKTEGQIEAILTALASSLKEQPGGSLQLKIEIRKLGDPELNFLGYRFLRAWRAYGGFGCARPSRKSEKKFDRLLAKKLLFAADNTFAEVIEKECERWVLSFPAWEGRERTRYLAVIHAENDVAPLVDHVRREIRRNKISWSDFASMDEFRKEWAKWCADCAPRLHSTGGPIWTGDDQDPGYGYAPKSVQKRILALQ